MRKIKSNKVKCLECGSIIESKDRHDFVTCPCGASSVDGGKDYLKRCFKYYGCFEELSEYEKDESE